MRCLNCMSHGHSPVTPYNLYNLYYTTYTQVVQCSLEKTPKWTQSRPLWCLRQSRRLRFLPHGLAASRTMAPSKKEARGAPVPTDRAAKDTPPRSLLVGGTNQPTPHPCAPLPRLGRSTGCFVRSILARVPGPGRRCKCPACPVSKPPHARRVLQIGGPRNSARGVLQAPRGEQARAATLSPRGSQWRCRWQTSKSTSRCVPAARRYDARRPLPCPGEAARQRRMRRQADARTCSVPP